MLDPNLGEHTGIPANFDHSASACFCVISSEASGHNATMFFNLKNVYTKVDLSAGRSPNKNAPPFPQQIW
jgi:hypothetical protein